MNPQAAIARVGSSSTAWVALLLIVLQQVAQRYGFFIPWEIVATGVGAYGAKEAGRYLGQQSNSTLTTKVEALTSLVEKFVVSGGRGTDALTPNPTPPPPPSNPPSTSR